MKDSSSSEEFCQYASDLKNKISTSILNSSEIQVYIDSLINYSKSTFSTEKSIFKRKELHSSALSSSSEINPSLFEFFQSFAKYASTSLEIRLGKLSSFFSLYLNNIKDSNTPEEFFHNANSLKKEINSKFPKLTEIQFYIDSLINPSITSFYSKSYVKTVN